VRVDGRWYKTLANTATPTTGPDLEGSSETWRDPVVIRDPEGDGWHLLVTARSVAADRNDDGVIAHAASPDLYTWTLGPPLCDPGAGFGQLEVLQNVVVAGRPVLAFTCHPQEQTSERIAEWGEYCTWLVPSAGALGPWDMNKARPFLPEPDLFAAPIVRLRDGSSAIIGFRKPEPKGDPGNLGLEIIDPISVTLDDEGHLVAR
jgi:beta-fructofuranosidase